MQAAQFLTAEIVSRLKSVMVNRWRSLKHVVAHFSLRRRHDRTRD
jgi:hypothetical protein